MDVSTLQANSPPATRVWRQTALISIFALAGYLLVRWIPLSVDPLHYTDFHAGGKSFLEFCEPGSPQFVPVDRVRSPISLRVETRGPPRVGEVVHGIVTLETSAGKAVAEDSLLVVHTEKLHLLVIDDSLDEYHHLHPRPTDVPGAFAFDFMPRSAGRYRLFADFTPRATGRGLYAGAELKVADMSESALRRATVEERESWFARVGDHEFRLSSDQAPIRINEATELSLDVSRPDGAPVALEEIMGARAHLVAFDRDLSGFAHLHPAEATRDEGATGANLGFTLLLTDPGYYRLWAQVRIAGEERFASFGLRVLP